uniref:FYVE-type domain-containing protein n=1 Tax=Noctiluca scintillans TaxID=2966 RepID=A0A7S1A1Y3_NOCSC|mmetsp:Transcript_28557/g.75312  ORF Transcript_28557/g.75312 Transcript_28557/m.75312 type:complete len:610 (+) Transcript_28557:58-1887(+)
MPSFRFRVDLDGGGSDPVSMVPKPETALERSGVATTFHAALWAHPVPQDIVDFEEPANWAELTCCAICDTNLGKRRLKPRHHCRVCGNTVCDKCSKSSVTLDGKVGLQRACNHCAGSLWKLPSLRARLTEVVRVVNSVTHREVATPTFGEPAHAGTLEEVVQACEIAVAPLTATSVFALKAREAHMQSIGAEFCSLTEELYTLTDTKAPDVVLESIEDAMRSMREVVGLVKDRVHRDALELVSFRSSLADNIRETVRNDGRSARLSDLGLHTQTRADREKLASGMWCSELTPPSVYDDWAEHDSPVIGTCSKKNRVKPWTWNVKAINKDKSTPDVVVAKLGEARTQALCCEKTMATLCSKRECAGDYDRSIWSANALRPPADSDFWVQASTEASDAGRAPDGFSSGSEMSHEGGVPRNRESEMKPEDPDVYTTDESSSGPLCVQWGASSLCNTEMVFGQDSVVDEDWPAAWRGDVQEEPRLNATIQYASDRTHSPVDFVDPHGPSETPQLESVVAACDSNVKLPPMTDATLVPSDITVPAPPDDRSDFARDDVFPAESVAEWEPTAKLQAAAEDELRVQLDIAFLELQLVGVEVARTMQALSDMHTANS